MLRGVFAIIFFPITDSQFIVYTCGWFLTIEETSSHLAGDDWPSTESSLSMLSSSSELPSNSDQLVPLSHPVASAVPASSSLLAIVIQILLGSYTDLQSTL